jgi:hypothetical protein
MRYVVFVLAIATSSCYLRHWRESSFCEMCLSNRHKPACQAACDTRKKGPVYRCESGWTIAGSSCWAYATPAAMQVYVQKPGYGCSTSFREHSTLTFVCEHPATEWK